MGALLLNERLEVILLQKSLRSLLCPKQLMNLTRLKGRSLGILDLVEHCVLILKPSDFARLGLRRVSLHLTIFLLRLAASLLSALILVHRHAAASTEEGMRTSRNLLGVALDFLIEPHALHICLTLPQDMLLRVINS